MPDHRAIAILDAFTDALMDLSLTGDNVFKGRIQDHENTPSHSVYLGRSAATIENTAIVDQAQLIRDEVTVKGREEELDAAMLNIHREAYVAIMADITLGLPYVIDTFLLDMAEPEFIDDGRYAIQSAVFTWQVNYRHSYQDPGA